MSAYNSLFLAPALQDYLKPFYPPSDDSDDDVDIPPLIAGTWSTLDEAKDAVRDYMGALGLSYKVDKAETFRWIAECRDKARCPFRIRITYVRT